jgi:hypothetical protein
MKLNRQVVDWMLVLSTIALASCSSVTEPGPTGPEGTWNSRQTYVTEDGAESARFRLTINPITDAENLSGTATLGSATMTIAEGWWRGGLGGIGVDITMSNGVHIHIDGARFNKGYMFGRITGTVQDPQNPSRHVFNNDAIDLDRGGG